MSERWIVGFDRPYYPSVEEFDNRDDAVAAYQQIITSEHEPDGDRDAKVWLAKVEESQEMRTWY